MPKQSPARQRVVEAHKRLDGNVSAIARELGLVRSTVQEHLRNAGINRPVIAGQSQPTGRSRLELPPEGVVRRYIFTCAQNNTKVWQPFWRNLMEAVNYFDATLYIASFTYNQNAYGRMSVKRGTKKPADMELVYADEVKDYLEDSDQEYEIAPGLIWCGRLNILPTAVNPLSGFETYTGSASSIIPHAKIAMRSVAQPKDNGAKFLYTTGTVTQHNYIQKTAGQKAEFHHAYGALLVEVESDGTWYARQLNADKTGRFYDLDACFDKGEITEDNRAEGIDWGDLHIDTIEDDVFELAWGIGGMLEELRPKFQFYHDSDDFRARNHHDIKNPHAMFRHYVRGRDDVKEEAQRVVDFFHDTAREWCQTIVVDSNHDAAIARWLREADYRRDPVNAVFFLKLQAAVYQAIEDHNPDFHLFEHACRLLGCDESIRFLRGDESFLLCKKIEAGMHGHKGPNGQRGSPQNLAKLGVQANTNHVHSAGIFDGLYVAGVTGSLDQGYNGGPSSWSHSHTVTYPNGKRAIITFRKDWRARD